MASTLWQRWTRSGRRIRAAESAMHVEETERRAARQRLLDAARSDLSPADARTAPSPAETGGQP
jgi:hypothetical protein